MRCGKLVKACIGFSWIAVVDKDDLRRLTLCQQRSERVEKHGAGVVADDNNGYLRACLRWRGRVQGLAARVVARIFTKHTITCREGYWKRTIVPWAMSKDAALRRFSGSRDWFKILQRLEGRALTVRKVLSRMTAMGLSLSVTGTPFGKVDALNVSIDLELFTVCQRTISANAVIGNDDNGALAARNESVLSATPQRGIDDEAEIESPKQTVKPVSVVLDTSFQTCPEFLTNDYSAPVMQDASYVMTENFDRVYVDPVDYPYASQPLRRDDSAKLEGVAIGLYSVIGCATRVVAEETQGD